MPEYLAPGVFVEEVSFRSKSIEGVSTTTTGLIGPARYGPIADDLEVITSLVEFERTYGDGQQLDFSDQPDPMHNYLWHAARAFFEQGGKRLYVKRVFNPRLDGNGHARAFIPASASTVSPPDPAHLLIEARFPGRAGMRRARLTLSAGPNILSGVPGAARAVGISDLDIVMVRQVATASPPESPPASPPAAPPPPTVWFGRIEERTTPTGPAYDIAPLGGGSLIPVTSLMPDPDPTQAGVHLVTATVTVLPSRDDDLPWVRAELPVDPAHTRFDNPDSAFALLGSHPPSKALARTNPIVLTAGATVTTGLDVLTVLMGANAGLATALANPKSTETQRSVDVLLDGGDDGLRPVAADYEGIHNPAKPLTSDPDAKLGLTAFEDIEDISIVAAPGSTFNYENGYRTNAQSILELLRSHAERMRYRIAVLDSGNGQTIAAVSALRGRLDSKHAALYYPWVRVLDPITQTEIVLPPSGFVAGIYARNDVNRAVYKAPANEVVTGAIGFETLLNKAQQEVLNPLGVNCFRFFEGRGFRLWGARTVSSDPEWKYVNLRRYFAYLERSIDVGTQWAVFEPNGEQLWANVRRTISDFLLNEFVSGALLGDKPEVSYFVKCDRSTMTQNDLDNGRLVCLIGVAPLRPAEFVIFRIGQWTADRKV